MRVAGAVITRQRPGTAKGFVFLTMEDETGLSNVIIKPDTYALFKRVVVDEPYLLVEGILQNQDGAVSVKAERIESLKAVKGIISGLKGQGYEFKTVSELIGSGGGDKL